MSTKFQKELFSYIIVGLFAVSIDFLFYKIFSDVFLIDISNSKRLSFVLGASFSFFFNKFLTFKSFERKLSQVFLFAILYFISFIFNSLSHDFLLNYISGNNPFYIATAISIITNYLGQKFIVFKKTKSIFGILHKLNFLQTILSKIVCGINPAIIHNVEKYWAINKTVYLNSLEQQKGDYVEFGVYTGSSFCHAIRCFNKLEKFNPNQRKTKFIGFDSFEGFGKLEDFDQHPFYVDTNFDTDFNSVKKRVKKVKRKGNESLLVKGYFEETLSKSHSEYNIENIRIAFIDSDTYASSNLAFNFIENCISSGSHIILDDFYSYNGDPNKGVSRALKEFLDKSGFSYRKILNYGMGGIVIVLHK